MNLDDYPLAKQYLEEHNLTVDDIDTAIRKKLEELNRGS